MQSNPPIRPDIEDFSDEIESRTQFSDVLELLSDWRRICARTGGLPDRSDFQDRLRGREGGNLMVLRPVDNDFLYEAVGQAIPPLFGYDPCGSLLGKLTFPGASSHLQLYLRCVESRAPLFSIQSRVDQGVPGVTERLMLPIRVADEIGLLVYVRTRADNYDLVRAIFNASQHGVIAVSAIRDREGRPIDLSILAVNAAAAALVGESPDDLIGRRLRTVVPDIMWMRMWTNLRASLEIGETRVFEVNEPNRHMPGIYRVSSARLGDGLAITISDLTQLRRALQTLESQHAALAKVNAELRSEVVRRRRLETELKQLAASDPLTGIANRRAFIDAMTASFEGAVAACENAALILFDIDDFKAINDRYGHPVGDIVLRKITEGVANTIASSSQFGRLGGEEFAVFLRGADRVDVCAMAETLRRTIAETDFEVPGASFRVTASFGVAMRDVPGESAEDLISAADGALYIAKRDGRNRVEFRSEPVGKPDPGAV